MYPDYNVKNIKSFKELLTIMASDHESEIAFSCAGQNWPYKDVVIRILELCTSISMLKTNKVRIDLNEAVSFSTAYLATVIVGKIAVLGETAFPLDEDTEIISDDNYALYVAKQAYMISDLPDTDINAPCTILHSSGTSSTPKGIMLSQNNLCSDVVGGLQKYLMQKGDRFINLIPYYHAFGLVCDLLGPFLVGATIHVLENKKMFLTEMARIKPTIINVPPVMAEILLKLIKSTGGSDTITGGCLRKILCGGAGLKADVARELRNYGIYAYGCYGLSECSPCVAVNRDNYYKDGSAGIPLNCNNIVIADDGEILITGSNVMLGYYNDPESTARVIRNGVLYTGDIGLIDEDGFLFITGRKSNLIVFSDGTKCIPEVIEEQIVINTSAEEALVYQTHNNNPNTLNVRIYLPDIATKEEVLEYIVNNLTCRKFDMIEFTTEPLPKNATGKIRRTM